MNTDILTLSQAAGLNADGTLNIGGAFDLFRFFKLPGILPPCGAAARIRFAHAEQGNWPVTFSITDMRGTPLNPPVVVVVQRTFQMPAGEQTNSLFVETPLPQAVFYQYGDYVLRLVVGAREIAAVPLYIR